MSTYGDNIQNRKCIAGVYSFYQKNLIQAQSRLEIIISENADKYKLDIIIHSYECYQKQLLH